MTRLDIKSDSPRALDVAQLMEAHRIFAVTWSQPGVGHALDVGQLAADGISLFSARHSGKLGALDDVWRRRREPRGAVRADVKVVERARVDLARGRRRAARAREHVHDREHDGPVI